VAPAISDATPSSVSPEGRTLVVVTTLDETGAKALGVESGPVVVGFDGPAGAIWARPLTSFSSCNPNGHGFTWSADHHRVFVATDTGRGLRVALVAVDDRVVRFQGFTSPVVTPSPDLQHVAWTPWFSGYPATDGTDGDLLHVDDLDVWGSIKPGAAEVWDVAWTTDATLTFCGRTPKLPAARYAAFIRGKRGVRVERVRTDCPSK
jgi:hypothetical protein